MINPNTSGSVSALLHAHAQRVAGPGNSVHTVTARFGAPYIACEASYAVAGHAVLDAWAQSVMDTEAQTGRAEPGWDAILIACFGDPGLLALRETTAVPVTGLAEAAFTQAAVQGRFAIVTGGERWGPMLERLAHALGFGDHVCGIHTVAQSGAELARDPVAAQALLTTACQAAAQRFGAQAVILGGAGLAGMAARVAPAVGVPVIDSVEAGVRHALSIAKAPAISGAPGAKQPVFDFSWTHMSPALTALGAPPLGGSPEVRH
jgi:Asp/Glu/hydantoin racemase